MKKAVASLLILHFTAALVSCSITGKETTPPSAALYVVHASADALGIDVTASGVSLATNLIYGQDTGYIFLSPGLANLKVSSAGTNGYFLNSNLSFTAGKYYSIFAIDSVSKIKIVTTLDELSPTGIDSSRIRFFQFSPGTYISYALFTKSPDTLVYFNRSFNDQTTNAAVSAFKSVKSGTYNLTVKKFTGTDTTFNTFKNIQFTSGKSYTVYLKGFHAGIGAQAFNVGILEHTP